MDRVSSPGTQRLAVFLAATALVLGIVAAVALRANPIDASLAAVTASPSSTPSAGLSSLIASRLSDRGVPITQVRIVRSDPLEVHVTIQSDSVTDETTAGDIWHKAVAWHVLRLGRRFGIAVEGFTVQFEGRSGLHFAQETHYVHPQAPSRSGLLEVNAQGSDPAVDSQFMQLFDSRGTTVLSHSITPLDSERKEGRVVHLRLEARDANQVNRELPGLIWGFRSTAARVNSAAQAGIVLAHLLILAPDGSLLVEYVQDVEIGSQVAKFGDGVTPLHGVGSPFVSPLPTPAPAPFVSPLLTPSPPAP